MREHALAAIKHLSRIIQLQFGFPTNKIISGTEDVFFLQKAAEDDPFFAKYYLKNGPLVSPYYSVEFDDKNKRWLHFDWNNYEDKMISDQEFVGLYNDRKKDQLAPTIIPWGEISVCRL